MATFFGSPAILSHPITKSKSSPLSSSSSPQTPPNNPQQSSSTPPLPNLATSSEQPQPKPVVKPTKADSTDWIASSLTRRFGLGAALLGLLFSLLGSFLNKSRLVSKSPNNWLIRETLTRKKKWCCLMG